MQLEISSSELMPGSVSHHRRYVKTGLRSVLWAGTSTGAQQEMFGSASVEHDYYTRKDAERRVCWCRSRPQPSLSKHIWSQSSSGPALLAALAGSNRPESLEVRPVPDEEEPVKRQGSSSTLRKKVRVAASCRCRSRCRALINPEMGRSWDRQRLLTQKRPFHLWLIYMLLFSKAASNWCWVKVQVKIHSWDPPMPHCHTWETHYFGHKNVPQRENHRAWCSPWKLRIRRGLDCCRCRLQNYSRKKTCRLQTVDALSFFYEVPLQLSQSFWCRWSRLPMWWSHSFCSLF